MCPHLHPPTSQPGKKVALNGNSQARPGSPPLQKHGFPFNYAWPPGGTPAWWSDKSEMAALLATGSMPASPVVTDTQCCGIILQKHKSARLHIVPINNVFLSEQERMDLNASVKITNIALSTRLWLSAVLTLAMMGRQIRRTRKR